MLFRSMDFCISSNPCWYFSLDVGFIFNLSASLFLRLVFTWVLNSGKLMCISDCKSSFSVSISMFSARKSMAKKNFFPWRESESMYSNCFCAGLGMFWL